MACRPSWGEGDAKAFSSREMARRAFLAEGATEAGVGGGDVLGVTELRWGGNEEAEWGEREV